MYIYIYTHMEANADTTNPKNVLLYSIYKWIINGSCHTEQIRPNSWQTCAARWPFSHLRLGRASGNCLGLQRPASRGQELVQLGSTGHWAYGYGGYGSIENPGSGYESETSTQSLCSTQGSWRFDAADLSKLLQFSTASFTDKVDQHLPESWISLDISL